MNGFRWLLPNLLLVKRFWQIQITWLKQKLLMTSSLYLLIRCLQISLIMQLYGRVMLWRLPLNCIKLVPIMVKTNWLTLLRMWLSRFKIKIMVMSQIRILRMQLNSLLILLKIGLQQVRIMLWIKNTMFLSAFWQKIVMYWTLWRFHLQWTFLNCLHSWLNNKVCSMVQMMVQLTSSAKITM